MVFDKIMRTHLTQPKGAINRAPTDLLSDYFVKCIIAPYTGDGKGLRLSDIGRGACALALAGRLTLG